MQLLLKAIILLGIFPLDLYEQFVPDQMSLAVVNDAVNHVIQPMTGAEFIEEWAESRSVLAEPPQGLRRESGQQQFPYAGDWRLVGIDKRW